MTINYTTGPLVKTGTYIVKWNGTRDDALAIFYSLKNGVVDVRKGNIDWGLEPDVMWINQNGRFVFRWTDTEDYLLMSGTIVYEGDGLIFSNENLQGFLIPKEQFNEFFRSAIL